MQSAAATRQNPLKRPARPLPARRLEPRIVALIAAALIHGVIGGLILLDGLDEEVRQVVEFKPELWGIPLELQRTPRRRSSATAGLDETVTDAPTPRRTSNLPFSSNTVALPSSASSTATPEASAAPNADDGWRVDAPGRERAPWGGEVCRDLSNLRAWLAANCRENGPVQPAAARGSPPAEIARPEAARPRAPGQTAQEGFAEQAAANEAWRTYTRERDAPYPGLRSLARHH